MTDKKLIACPGCYRPFDVDQRRRDNLDERAGAENPRFCSDDCALKSWRAPIPFKLMNPSPEKSPRPVQFKRVEEWVKDYLSNGRAADMPGAMWYGHLSQTGKTSAGIYCHSRLACGLLLSGDYDEADYEHWYSPRLYERAYRSIITDYAAKGEWLERLSECPVLTIDDIDKIHWADGLAALTYEAIDSRLSNGLPTIFTANATADELNPLFKDRGPYLVGRIRTYCRSINFDPDFNQ